MAAEWLSEQPTNRNFLTPIGFKLSLELFPGVDFFCQSASIPDISMPFAEIPTPYRNIPIAASGGVQFGDFTVRFIIDEDLNNYKLMHDWIRKYGLSDSRLPAGETDQYSIGNLEILTSHNNPNRFIEFLNLFPISLSGVPFDATVSDIDYLTADVTFKYEKYTIGPQLVRSTASSTAAPTVTLTNSTSGNWDPSQNFSLQWTSTNVASLSIDQSVGSVGAPGGSKSLTGTTESTKATNIDSLTSSLTYTITAVGLNGTTVTAQTTITFLRPQTSVNRVCIAVIDESQGDTYQEMEARWNDFRTNWPDRHFYLLQPSDKTTGGMYEPSIINDLRVPPSFLEQTDPDSTTVDSEPSD